MRRVIRPAALRQAARRSRCQGHPGTFCPVLATSNNAFPANKGLADDIAFVKELVAAKAAKGT